MVIAYAVSYAVTYIATGSVKATQGAGLPAGLFMGIGGLRGGKIGADGKMHYNPGWEPGSMKTLVAHGLAGGIVQDRMGGSFGAGFLAGSLGSYLGSSGKSSKANEMIGNTAIEAVIGGTISMIGGGKFANGTQTRAFRYLFNENMHDSNAYVSGYKCMGNCHGVDYSDIKFMSVEEQENLAKNVALGLVTLPIGGGAVALVRAGYTLKVWRYKNGGIGVNILKNERRRFGVDVHEINYKGVEKVRLHYHRGFSKRKMKKHRSYDGGW